MDVIRAQSAAMSSFLSSKLGHPAPVEPPPAPTAMESLVAFKASLVGWMQYPWLALAVLGFCVAMSVYVVCTVEEYKRRVRARGEMEEEREEVGEMRCARREKRREHARKDSGVDMYMGEMSPRSFTYRDGEVGYEEEEYEESE